MKKTTARKTKGPRTPQIRTHRRSQRCYVTLSGQTFWLGAADDPARFAVFADVVRDWEARGRQPLDDDEGDAPVLTVGDLVQRYRAHRIAEKGAEWLSSAGNGCRVHYALEALQRLYGHEPAGAFGPKKLKAVRAALIHGGQWKRQKRCCRGEANARVRELQRMFRWAVSEELIDAAVAHAIDCVEPIGEGDRTAHDNAPRTAADQGAVAAVLPYLPAVPRIVVELLQLTGARPSELLRLRRGDVDDSNPEQWVAMLTEHKTARHGKARVLVFEAEAIALLRPLMKRAADAHLFTPRDSEAEFRKRLSDDFAAARGEQPNAEAVQHGGDGARRWRPHYDANALRLAVARALAACNADRKARRLPPVPAWSPYSLRHARATEVALVASESDATVLLGHAAAQTTARYLHAEVERARRASRRVRELEEQQRKAASVAS